MAIVDNAVWEMNIGYKDYNDNNANETFYYPGAESAANVQGYLTGSLIPAIVGVSDAVITGYRYSFGGSETDPTALTALPNSNVEKKMSIVFRDEGGGVMKVEVPSPRASLLVAGTANFDPANPAVAALIAALLKSGALDTASVVNFRGMPLVARLGAVHQIHRGSRKG
jgi:hypothetical protein